MENEYRERQNKLNSKKKNRFNLTDVRDIMDELSTPSMNLKFFKGAKLLREIMNYNYKLEYESSDSNESSNNSESKSSR